MVNKLLEYLMPFEAFLRSMPKLLFDSRKDLATRAHVFCLELLFFCKATYSHFLQRPIDHEAFLGYDVLFPSYLEFFLVFVELFGLGEYSLSCSDVKSPSIIDCGSSWGLSIIYFLHLYPDAEIVAIEANPNTAELLRRNIRANGLNKVSLLNAMLSDTADTKRPFFVSPLAHSSSIADTADETLGRKMGYREILVNTIQLSSLLCKPVDILKLDIEGSEGRVLKEAGGHLKRVREIVLEHHRLVTNNSLDDIQSLLRENSFSCQISNTKRLPRLHKKAPPSLIVHATRS